jgi:DNA-binding response OmpR family regulator
MDARDGKTLARPVIVFVTAFGEFAAKAFEVRAVDYLLKPFDPARLDRALESAAARRKRRYAASEPSLPLLEPQLRARSWKRSVAFAPYSSVEPIRHAARQDRPSGVGLRGDGGQYRRQPHPKTTLKKPLKPHRRER